MNVTAAQSWNDLSTQLKTVVIVLLICQIVITAITLVVWWKTPDNRMPPPSRHAWIAIILLSQTLGAILFFVFRAKVSCEAALRTAETAASGSARTTDRGEALAHAVDTLYGSATPENQR